MINSYGFVRVGASSPKVKIGNPLFNIQEIYKEIIIASEKGVQLLVFPELSTTGYTCQDLFFQDLLLKNTLKEIEKLLDMTKHLDIIFLIGVPYLYNQKLYSSAFVIQKGLVKGIVLKSYIPSYNEFYEKRWFESGRNISTTTTIFSQEVLIGTDIIFEIDKLKFGVEICEDLWVPNSPSIELALQGCQLLFNLSASNELIGKSEYRKDLVRIQSAKTISAYVYASVGPHESTSDVVFSGACLISENGSILKESERFSFDNVLIYEDIDVDLLKNNRLKNTSFENNKLNYRIVKLDNVTSPQDTIREYKKTPFIPTDNSKKKLSLAEISNIQITALSKRIVFLNNTKLVIGLSGGLDSTLALLVIYSSLKKLNLDSSHIVAITMPGFATSSNTLKNTKILCQKMGIQLKKINITKSATQQLKDLKHPLDLFDITYENVQARTRTEILMNTANQVGGIVIGTGDLSEIALGWSTYNGDHMSMYNVNSSIPKTLVKHLVEYYISVYPKLKTVLTNIINTPISPELVPMVNMQRTEDIIGKYILHDFFLYHFIRYGAEPRKLEYLAVKTFPELNKHDIHEQLIVFIKRFFNAQFKRNCVPDGPKVGSISLSPRGDWRMPSEAVADIWLNNLKD
ncbi:MAG: NAD(+) synthase [Bacillales bacterium]|jgi:NAD+ synthase (glutamine-hydrolysing)|nr:NAD(+) synthase [Bacillales bacterium]